MTTAAAATAKKPLGKTELIDVVAKATGLEKTKGKAVIEASLDAITKELKKGGKVQLTGFGTFGIARRKKRTGVNPKTGAKIVPERNKGEDRDSVELSSLSSSLSAASDREAKIEQLRLDVQAGRYNPPAGEIARSIIDATLSERK